MDWYGRDTFDWPSLHCVRQKPLDYNTVDHNIDRWFLGKMDT